MSRPKLTVEKTMLSIRIDSGVIKRVRELAEQENRNVSNWIETKLREIVEKKK